MVLHHEWAHLFLTVLKWGFEIKRHLRKAEFKWERGTDRLIPETTSKPSNWLEDEKEQHGYSLGDPNPAHTPPPPPLFLSCRQRSSTSLDHIRNDVLPQPVSSTITCDVLKQKAHFLALLLEILVLFLRAKFFSNSPGDSDCTLWETLLWVRVSGFWTLVWSVGLRDKAFCSVAGRRGETVCVCVCVGSME